MIGVSAGRLRAYLRAGVLSPEKGTRGELRFSFQDLLLLRKAEGVVNQRISPHRVRRALKALRERLTDEQPLTGVSLGTDGPQVVVHERGARWQAGIGAGAAGVRQAGAAAAEAPLVALPTRPTGERPASDVVPPTVEIYELACDLDEADPERAESSYRPGDHTGATPRRRAHQPGADPARARRAAPPRRYYRRALAIRPNDATASFNLGRARGRRTSRRRARGLPARHRRRRPQRRSALQRRPPVRSAGRLCGGPAPPAHLPGPRAQRAIATGAT